MISVLSFMSQRASLCPSLPPSLVWAQCPLSVAISCLPSPILGWAGLGPSRALVPPWTLSSSGCYSLSVRLSRPASWDRIRHYRIQHLDNGWLYISPRLTFPSLQALVDHYSGTAIPYLHESRLGCGSVGKLVIPSDTLPAGEYLGKSGTSPLSMPVPMPRNTAREPEVHLVPAEPRRCPVLVQASASPTTVVLSQSPQWLAQFSAQELGPELLLLWNSVDSQHFLVPVL